MLDGTSVEVVVWGALRGVNAIVGLAVTETAVSFSVMATSCWSSLRDHCEVKALVPDVAGNCAAATSLFAAPFSDTSMALERIFRITSDEPASRFVCDKFVPAAMLKRAIEPFGA